ncbi:MAG TPA: extracellular solute-binding protein, partial [Planctomycetota bacterium]|nr:extracellular solute-binding protein [Planctomycetota bacterium]
VLERPLLAALVAADPRRRLLVTAHRRESWGEPMERIGAAIARLAADRPDLLVLVPIHANPVVRQAIVPAVEGLDNVSTADADVIVIPKGSRHPEEAWEFIKFVNSQEGMEILCMGQRKFSPLKRVSPEFWQKHPHPYIKLFRDLAESPNVVSLGKTGVWREYHRELNNAFDKVRFLSAEPKDALAEVRERIQKSLDRERRRLLARGVIQE